ncbi:MAG TPA: zinc ribbon domain-containing protein [Candidatus Ozemobacteraceae bacterium]|nr:zinc ribbon domain-containing protein [Candidatus Ozemobacteraceae bacterium]
MEDIKRLEEHFTDCSVESGSETGIQFKIACYRCKRSWESEFIPKTKSGGVVSKFFKKDSANPVDTEWEKAKAAALTSAAEQVEDAFKFCPRCEHFVCLKCWNAYREMCLECVAGISRAALEEAYNKSHEEVEEKCKKCGTVVTKMKFCPKCGEKVSRGECPGCTKKLPPEAAFCPECGYKVK